MGEPTAFQMIVWSHLKTVKGYPGDSDKMIFMEERGFLDDISDEEKKAFIQQLNKYSFCVPDILELGISLESGLPIWLCRVPDDGMLHKVDMGGYRVHINVMDKPWIEVNKMVQIVEELMAFHKIVMGA